MRCEHYLDLKTTGVSIYPLLDSVVGIRGCTSFLCVSKLIQQLTSVF